MCRSSAQKLMRLWLSPHASRVLFLALSVTLLFFHFVCHSNISGTAEQICAKFTGKTCLVRRSKEFECQGHGHQGQKMRCALRSTPAATKWNALAENDVIQQRTAPFRRCREGVISPACVRSMFGKTSLLQLSLVDFMRQFVYDRQTLSNLCSWCGQSTYDDSHLTKVNVSTSFLTCDTSCQCR